MTIKYIPFFTENMEEQVRFFTEKLKFKVVDKVSMFEHAAGHVMQSANQDVLVAIADHKNYRNCTNCIVLSTDDCLKDYHQLLAEGLVFTKEPHYLPIGLVAEFADQFNNRYVLIEERNYNEDL
jgi:predicted enzyme related to lactoylglutathione lyase